MAESRRAGASRPRKVGSRTERLTPLNLILNAVGAFVVGPALFVGAAMLWFGDLADEESRALNQHLFLGAVSVLIGLFFLVLGGLKVYEHVKARRRFQELIEGDRKSALVQHLDELSDLARALGPSYRQRLDGRLAELGIKR